MGKSENKRQKQLAKRKQKAKKRKQAQAGSTPFDALRPEKKIREARRFPVYECLINKDWQSDGVANILISRIQPNGKFLFGMYLVDVFCMGLKNTFANADLPLDRYKTVLIPRFFNECAPVECPLELAHAIIYGGIDYAAQFGFAPNRDFELSQCVLEARGSLAPVEVTFGRDGKPLFIAGPHDNAERVLKQLEEKTGRENYHYVVPVGPPPSGFEDDRPAWDSADDAEAFEVKMEEWAERDWPVWMAAALTFPFAATRVEDASASPLQETRLDVPFALGHAMQVIGLAENADGGEDDGLLVKVQEGRDCGVVPLCDLEVAPEDDPNVWPVREYAAWMANC